MTHLLTQAQVYDLARSVGFSTANARIAAAIAMCEAPYTDAAGVSYSNVDAVGDQALANDTWGFSYGCWQVRSLRADKGTGRLRDEELLIGSPKRQAFVARQIKLAAGSFNPWSTYTGGQYRAYLLDETGAIAFPPPLGSYVVVGGDTLSGITAKLSDGKWTWQELAAANGIVKPYTIHIGQTLLLPFDRTGV
jgi:nucleoid-associated protein YgaU